MLLDKNDSINNILEETRVFPPSNNFSSKSRINSIEPFRRNGDDPYLALIDNFKDCKA